MAGVVLITIDGVLADRGDEPSFAAAKLTPEAILLFRSFSVATNVVLLSLQPERDAHKVEYWLKIHGFTNHVGLLYDPWPTDVGRSVDTVVNEVRRTGGLTLAVEADPERGARLLHHGVSTVMVARPAYTRGEFQPGDPRAARPWQEVIEELDAQQGINSEDKRVTAEVAGRKYVD